MPTAAKAMRCAHIEYTSGPITICAAMQHVEDMNKGMKIMTFLAKLFPRVVTREQAELAYLNGSANLYDLEMREREVARGKFARI